MPLLLAIETSTDCCSAALGNGHFLLERSVVRPREHHALLLPMVAELLAEAALERSAIDAIAFGRGPGSFTGLRIATGFAQGLGFALERPLIPVSSLAALALAAFEQAGERQPGARVRVATDAHMGEIFHAVYCRTADGVSLDGVEGLASATAFPAVAPLTEQPLLLAGAAWSLYPGILPPGATPPGVTVPLARQVLSLALASDRTDWIAAEAAEPHYVRGVSAWKTRAEQARQG